MMYKFREVAPVTDESIEVAVNEMVSQGWAMDSLHFAMGEGSKRPAMAFIAFVKEPENGDTGD